MGFLDKLFGRLFGKKKEIELYSNIEPVNPKPQTKRLTKVQPDPVKETTPDKPILAESNVVKVPLELSFDLEVPKKNLKMTSNFIQNI